jgi:hypothetical protein
MIHFLAIHWLQIILTLILSFGAGVSYRIGGSANGARFIRPLGIGILEFITLCIWFGFNWWMLLILGTAWIETTYFKVKGKSAVWWNWLLVGLSFSLVPLPWVIATHHWLGFGIRTLFLVPAIALWSELFGDVQWEEGGRGALQILSIPLLYI